MLDIYSFVLAGFLVTMGAVGDRIGRKRLLLIGAVAFGIASACAAYASSPGQLIFWRAVLGIAGRDPHAVDDGPASARSSPTRRSMMTAIGVWYQCFMGGMAVGPLVGGVLLAALLVGLGVPARRALHAAARRRRPPRAAGVRAAGRRARRRRQLGPVARRDPADHPRLQGDRPGRRHDDRPADDVGRLRARPRSSSVASAASPTRSSTSRSSAAAPSRRRSR